MKWILRVSALTAWCVIATSLSGLGCSTESTCPPDTATVLDNRDGQYPGFDADWLCLGKKGYSSPPTVTPPEPDVSGSSPLDPPGPKDPDALVPLIMLLESCTYDEYADHYGINRVIDDAYMRYRNEDDIQAMIARSLCVKGKTNGCDALRECYGLVEQLFEPPAFNSPPNPLIPWECVDGVFKMGGAGNGFESNTWMNCKGLGLECIEGWFSCIRPEVPCDPNLPRVSCEGERPFHCGEYGGGTSYSGSIMPSCAEFGLVCAAQTSWTDCTGKGALCGTPSSDPKNSPYYMYDLSDGITCESDTLMRACVGINEELIDCSQVGKGFTCLQQNGWATCGFALDCQRDDPVYCDGDSLVVCDGGKRRHVDCKSLGFKTCVPEMGICGPTDITIVKPQ